MLRACIIHSYRGFKSSLKLLFFFFIKISVVFSKFYLQSVTFLFPKFQTVMMHGDQLVLNNWKLSTFCVSLPNTSAFVRATYSYYQMLLMLLLYLQHVYNLFVRYGDFENRNPISLPSPSFISNEIWALWHGSGMLFRNLRLCHAPIHHSLVLINHASALFFIHMHYEP